MRHSAANRGDFLTLHPPVFILLTHFEIAGYFPWYSIFFGWERPYILEDPKAHAEPALQQVLLRLSEAAQRGSDWASLIRLFCRETRKFFEVDGAYFWQLEANGELVGTEADGLMAEHFRGRRLFFEDSALAIEAVRQRRVLSMNHVDPGRSSLAREFQARSLMAVPLLVSDEVIGAAVFLHASDSDFFHAGSMSEATILANQFGRLLEARRSMTTLAEPHPAAILTEVAQAARVVPDSGTVAEAIAEHLRTLLRTPLVAIFLRDGELIALEAVAAESPQLSSALRAGFAGEGLEFASELVARAVAAGEVISFPMGPAVPLNAGLASGGVLLAAPFRTSRTHGAIAVYPRPEGAFSTQEKSLLSAVSGFGAVAIANAELCRTARHQAEELERILSLSSELNSISRIEEFLEHLVLRATDFLGFDLGFVALFEGGALRLRSIAKQGKALAIEAALEGDLWSRALAAKDVVASEDSKALAATNFAWLTPAPVRQLLTVPLLSSNGQELGLLGVVDRSDHARISEGHLRSARSLAAHLTVGLESVRNLERSEEQRQRAEALVRTAWEWNRQLQFADLAKGFVAHVAQLMAAQAALLAVSEGGSWETLALDPTWEGNENFSPARLEVAIPRLLGIRGEAIVSSKLEELLGGEAGMAAGSDHVSLVRLLAADGELMGALCLVRQKPLERAEEQLLQAISAHASIAFENARLFTRMEAANRHWIGIFDAITDFIVAHDESDNVVRVNRPMADFIGVEPKELIGVKTYALFALTTGFTPRTCPFCRAVSEDGEDHILALLDRTYLVSTSRVEAATGGLETIHVLKDITDRREAERRYRELFDNIQEGVFFATSDGRFVEVNDTLLRLLAYDSREQLLKVDICTQVFTSPEHYDQFTALMLQNGVVRNHEQSLRRMDGSSIQVLINAVAVRDADERVIQYRGVMLDISGLRSSQSELQRERDFSGKILNNTQSLILVTDTAGLISYANRRWREMGYQPDQLWGKPLEDLIAAPRRPALREALAATLAGQQVDNLELQLVRGAGRLGHFSLNLSPMRDDQGNVTNIVVVMSDITDAASLQAKLIHAEKMVAVGQLVSGVAHEVNNPLTAILGFADLLLENPEIPESARKDLRVILQEAQRTKQIVQNLLSFARPMPPQRKPIELNAILDRTVQLRAYDFHSHGVEVLEHLDKDLHLVVGDSHQLQQVFLNILNNAYDAVRNTGRAARIEIRTTNLDHLVEVIFRDNGHGIESPERIFDPFFTTKDIGKGTGLGLSICQGIVREHGGEIFCHNNTDGVGATFLVRLPAVQESAPVRAAAGVAPR
ncbi:MAG TPA: PAS domain S-box protein [Terriglobales bacterium]|nr:PAS domain S-box protein [Terriglobales bacterium]